MAAFDLSDAGFIADPASSLVALRAEGPLAEARVPIVGRIRVTTTHAATTAVLKRADDFVLDGLKAGRGKGPAGMRWWMPRKVRLLADNMLAKDDPEHRRLRKLVDQAFARRGARDMRPAIAARARALLAEAPDAPFDLVPVLSRRLPLEVIAELLGVAPADRARFAETAAGLGEMTNLFGFWRGLRAISHLTDHVREMIAHARAAPRQGLIAELIAAEEGGDRLTESEMISMVLLLMFAGFETTTNLISGAVVALSRAPDQRDRLLTDFDGRIERATEELCRHVSAVAGTKPRYAARDTEVEGVTVKRGEMLMALPVAANCDPAVFAAPERLDLDRFPNPHLAFSTGPHFCLGMQLARVEAQEALRALYARWPCLTLDPERPFAYARRPGHRALPSLWVRP